MFFAFVYPLFFFIFIFSTSSINFHVPRFQPCTIWKHLSTRNTEKIFSIFDSRFLHSWSSSQSSLSILLDIPAVLYNFFQLVDLLLYGILIFSSLFLFLSNNNHFTHISETHTFDGFFGFWFFFHIAEVFVSFLDILDARICHTVSVDKN